MDTRRILITGAAGSVGTGMAARLVSAGHEVVLVDVVRPRALELLPGAEFHQLDLQIGVGLERAAAGCDLILHTAAWHGIHLAQRSPADFWRLNVDGTFWMLEAARTQNVPGVVFLSSQSWHAHFDRYGFTKRVGEELLEFARNDFGLRYIAVRPGDFTPWAAGTWPQRYGARLLYGGVDRDDVLDAVELSVRRLLSHDAGMVVDAVRPNAFAAEDLVDWQADPVAAVERAFPGAAEVARRFGLDVARTPQLTTTTGWDEIGYRPTRHFGTFVDEARGLTDAEVAER